MRFAPSQFASGGDSLPEFLPFKQEWHFRKSDVKTFLLSIGRPSPRLTNEPSFQLIVVTAGKIGKWSAPKTWSAETQVNVASSAGNSY